MISSLRKSIAAIVLGLLALAASGVALADPPYRVARVAYASGAVSFSPAGESDWARAAINRPLVTGDRLWVDAESRAELQLGGIALRIGDQTSLSLLNLDDRMAQVRLTQGVLEIRVWRLDPEQAIEIDTPNLAYSIRRTGSYRVEVDAQDGSTSATVRAGEATLYGEGNAFRARPGTGWRFYDTALRDYDTFAPEPADDLARWAFARDRRWERSVSAGHVPRELIGYEDLDEWGTWRQVPEYGDVWVPTRVSGGWAPYREGHWTWVDPWGWTWIDDAPWGFAPSHYGRWAFVEQRWCWVPGPINVRPVYAPALVAFVGGSNFNASTGVGGGAVGWFPLGPREVYRPSYPASREYFTRVNTSNTRVNAAQVADVYETRPANVQYANQRVPGALVAVAAAAFLQSRSVGREAMRVRAADVAPQAVMTAPPIAPAKASIFGPQPAQKTPPEHLFNRPVVAQTPPPPPSAPIESKLPALQANPGHAVAPASPLPGRPAPPQASAPQVRIFPATEPAVAPPPPSPAANRAEPRSPRGRERGEGPPRERPALFPQQQPAAQPVPAAPAPARVPPPPAAAPAPAAPPALPTPPASRNREEERQRERPSLFPQQRPAPPAAVPAPAAAPAPSQVAPPRPPAPAALQPAAVQPAPQASRGPAANPRAEARREAASQARQARQQRREESSGRSP